MKPPGLVLAGLLALTACSATEPAAERPSPATAAPPSAEPGVDLDAVVDDPEARITAVTVRHDDPSVRSVVWSLCRTPKCYRADQVVAVTDDGFATRHLRALTQQTSETALDGVFLLATRRASEILQPDGSRTTVDWDARRAGPLGPSEEPVGTHRFGEVRAVDPATGLGHLVPTPGEALGVSRDGSGALRVYLRPRAGGARLLTSYDGGRSWDDGSAFDPPPGQNTQPIDSSIATGAAVTGGDGATELPIGGLHAGDEGGWTTFAGFGDPTAYLGAGAGAVLPDGALLLSVGGWSDSWQDRPSRRPAGLWRSDGQDWSDLRPVPMGAPFDGLDLRRDISPILDIVVSPRRVTVYAVHDALAGRTLWSSTDAGRTWTEVAAR